MRRARRPPAVVTGVREAKAIAANLGRDARVTRRRRHWTQAALGKLVGLGQSEVSYLERGLGSRTSIETWISIGIALQRPISIGFSRDVVEPLQDAGHLDAQELVIRLARAAGWRASFEVPVSAERPIGSTDVLLEGRDGVTVLAEVWNRIDDLGAAARASDRKLTVAQSGRAAAREVRSLWLLTDTAANRAIVRRYPSVMRARFAGSSSAWVRAVSEGLVPPADAGIAWVDVRACRLRELRLGSG